MIFRIDSDLKKAFELAAKSIDRTASQMLRDYIRHVVDGYAKSTAQQELPLAPTKQTPTTTQTTTATTPKPKKGQKLAAAKPANWKR